MQFLRSPFLFFVFTSEFAMKTFVFWYTLSNLKHKSFCAPQKFVYDPPSYVILAPGLIFSLICPSILKESIDVNVIVIMLEKTFRFLCVLKQMFGCICNIVKLLSEKTSFSQFFSDLCCAHSPATALYSLDLVALDCKCYKITNVRISFIISIPLQDLRFVSIEIYSFFVYF